jgi:hypothetical protein
MIFANVSIIAGAIAIAAGAWAADWRAGLVVGGLELLAAGLLVAIGSRRRQHQ